NIVDTGATKHIISISGSSGDRCINSCQWCISACCHWLVEEWTFSAEPACRSESLPMLGRGLFVAFEITLAEEVVERIRLPMRVRSSPGFGILRSLPLPW
ncbi:MAG: hypothetical protein ACOVQK_04835, partial [Cyanobium sp.]